MKYELSNLTEGVLRENEEKYRSLFDGSKDAVVLTTQQGKVTDANPAALELFGYTKEEILKINFQDLYVDPKEGYKFQEKMGEKGSVQDFETRLRGKDDVEMDCILNVICRRGDDGSILEYQGIIRDISEAKRAQEALETSQQRLSQIINFLPDATFVIDLEGKVIAWNQAMEDLTGIKAPEMLGKGNYEYAIPLYGERRPVLIDLARQWNKEIEEKYQYVKKEGTSLISETYDSLVKPGGTLWNKASLLYDNNGEVIGAIESIRDITDRKVAEEALRENEEKYRTLVEQSLQGLVIAQDNPVRLSFVSKPMEAITGFSQEELTSFDSQQLMGLIHPEDRETFFRNFNDRLSGKEAPPVHEYRINHKTKGIRWVEIYSTRIEYNDAPAAHTVFLDITKRKLAEEAIRENEEKYRRIFNNAQVGIFRTRISDGKVLECNDRFAKTYGFDNRIECISEYISADHYVDPETRERMLAQLSEAGEVNDFDARFSRRDGSIVWVRFSARYCFDEGYLEGVGYDITQEKEAEEALQESEERYRTLVDNLPVAVYRNTPGPEGSFLMANPAFCKMFGYDSEEDVKKLKVSDLYANPKKRKQYSDNLIKKGIVKNHEQTLLKRDGTPVITSITASVVYGKDGEISHFDSIMLDITEQKKLEVQLLHAQKMEAIGTLAGGVAHDLNNILGGLVSYPELLLLQIPEESPLRKSILTIQRSGEKAAAVVQDLLTLARRGVVATEVVNLNDVISEYLKSPEHEKFLSYYPGVHVKTHLATDTLNISGSSTHLSKTVMNLISNALEAMPEGGKLTISTENRYIDRPIRGYDNIKEGDYVVLTISDTGTGISPEDMEKIFEPFYTKKKMGRSGTGLGMAVVWGTVKDHNGYIDVESDEGKARRPRLRARDGGQGTTFTLYFPVTRERLPEDKTHLAIESYSGNGESILVIDDVEEQRRIASGMLRELGYSVASVSSGEEAVEYLKTNKADLLVLDMIMDPGMDGLDTYKKILEIYPRQKAIIASGFSETDRAKEVQRLGAGVYIRKPLLLEKVGVAVKEELEK